MTIQIQAAEVSARSSSRGGIREVFLLAYPLILTQMSATAMGVVDSAMVGQLGATELGAVGFGGVWMWTLICFFIGTTTSVQTFVSQRHGAGETEGCAAWAWQGFATIVPFAGLASLAITLGAAPLVAALAPSPELQPIAAEYMSVRALGLVGFVSAVTISSFFRGLGDTLTPLRATVTANVVNALLDYGLIFGHWGLPEWGVYGAGFATAVAEWLYLGILAISFFGRRRLVSFGTRKPTASRRDAKRLLRVGAPIGGQWLLGMLSFATFTTLISHMGDTAMAASQAFVALLSLSFMQAVGLANAVSTLVGRYIGAQTLEHAVKSFRSALKLALMLAAFIAALYIGAPEWLLGFFTTDPAVLAYGRPLLVVGAFFQVFDALAIVSDGALRGAGDTRWPFWMRFALSWGVFVPLAYTLAIPLGFGLTGAWIGGCIATLLQAGVLMWRFRSGAWEAITI